MIDFLKANCKRTDEYKEVSHVSTLALGPRILQHYALLRRDPSESGSVRNTLTPAVCSSVLRHSAILPVFR